jgi:Ca2+-binding EF-hand superfamily protein
MAAFGEPLNDEEVKEILKYAKAVNGRIYYKDFVRTIINGKID